MQTNDDFDRDDTGLRPLLREWQAPAVPASLEQRVLQARLPWWRFLINGYVRVPVPVLCGATLLLLFAAWRVVEPAGANAPCIVAAHPQVCTSSVPGAC